MKISCNILKSHIKNSDKIDWLNIWDKFSIRTAEVEGVIQVGNDLDRIIVGEVISCEDHPTKPQYHVLKVNDGEGKVDVLCGAPNVRVGLKSAFVQVGGRIGDFVIEAKKIAGVTSYGMLCSGSELGISDDHEGIIELPDNYEVGRNIKDYLAIEDIIVEIDNKSLTNRPDLWGHYGIAREISAITGHELLPLDVYEDEIEGEDLDVVVHNYDYCPRYSAIKINNILNKQTPLNMQIQLFYVGMRSISLLVDLTNYLMIELGQPMHAFDAAGINKIEIGLGEDDTTFTTLDGINRKIDANTLMIKNNNKYFAIAGIMGGLESGINNDTNSIILESANFDAYVIRSASIRLGLRTEASARYEKSLDPNLTIIATKRFIKLLKNVNPEITFASRITDKKAVEFNSPTILLYKSTIKRNLGKELDDDFVVKTLSALSFKVKIMEDYYEVQVPTFRATKDVTIEADLIEELSRMYGYENIEKRPLKVDLTFGVENNEYQAEYNLKQFLALKYGLHEVHSYVWYKTSLLDKLKIKKDNVSVLGRSEDNILRDDLALSLLDVVNTNLKLKEQFSIFELGTTMTDTTNHRKLVILMVDEINNTEQVYLKLKEMVKALFINLKNVTVSFQPGTSFNYYTKVLDVIINHNIVGQVKLFTGDVLSNINRKKIIAVADININLFHEINNQTILYQEISKYPSVTLDYSIIMDHKLKYQNLKDILLSFEDQYLINYELIDKYLMKDVINYTVRFTIGSLNKTLDQVDIDQFKTKFLAHLKLNNLKIVE